MTAVAMSPCARRADPLGGGPR
ncbi:hypothetical protein R2601_03128 [Salipiger bermudensis HTCC2601]|uniref:Uncharacterized protein n=1 Tax=Salipiger bermudensis (strain DSM 26914 / JCM 13377 / KCTC 12554 / HTCC2601) TaxID=314265 RepID=Q0FWM0_SALBH|nr:hypothetical protein R2601_03128 [Salipiger bermudensis HTCC2601]